MVLLLKLGFLRKLNLCTRATGLLTHCLSSFWTLYQPISNTSDSIKYLKDIKLPQVLWQSAAPSPRDSGFCSYPVAAAGEDGRCRWDRCSARTGFGCSVSCRAPQHPRIRCELNAVLLSLPEWLVHAEKPLFQRDLSDFWKNKPCPRGYHLTLVSPP